MSAPPPEADDPASAAIAVAAGAAGGAGGAAEHPGRGAEAATRTQIRGSSLLLIGRLLSLAINSGVQVLIVRYLSKADYGAFAYALSLVSLGETVVTLGLDRAVTRFVPMYDERREYGKLLGTLALVLGTMLSLGVVTILLVTGLQGLIAGTLVADRQAVSLLAILILLAPIQALDDLSLGMFAVFARPAAIFFRRYVLAPGLRMVVVLLLIAGHSGAAFLAVGYVAAGAAGVVIYGVILVRAMRARGLFAAEHRRAFELPFREIFGFTLPLLTSDLVYTVMHVSDTLLLGYFRGTTEVGAFRAVLPIAKLNQLAISAFALLFMPAAARLFAREDTEGVNHLYWQTAMWLAVLSYPVFALTFALAQPLTVTLFGSRYAGSGVFLALLSFGTYIQAASGFNGQTLKVVGRLRYIVTINVAAAAVNLALLAVLVPWLGALGAAVATCIAQVIHNVLKQAGLRRGTGVALFPREGLRVYAAIAAGTCGLLAVQLLAAPPFWAGFGLAAVVSLAVLAVSRPVLRIGEMFPELLRYRLLRILIGG